MVKYFLVALGAACFIFWAGNSGAAEDAALQGKTLYQQENYEEAADVLKKVESANAGTAESAYYLGLSQVQLGDYDEAEQNLKKALSMPNPAKDAVIALLYLYDGTDRQAESEKWISWAEKENVRPGEISYLKGLLLVKQGKKKEAMAAFTRAKTTDPSLSQRADLQIAAIHVSDSNYDAAKASLNAVITSNPSSDVAVFAKEYEQKLEMNLATAKHWHLVAGVSYQWDDNAVAKPVHTVPGTIFPKRESGGIAESLLVTYNSLSDGPWQFSAQYNLYNNNYFKLSHYSQFSNTLTLIPSYNAKPPVFSLPFPVIISAPVSYNYTFLGYDGYSQQVSVTPTATAILAPSHLAQFAVGYARREVYDTILPSENRDAHILNTLLGYYYMFAEDKGLFNGRFEYVYEDTDGSAWKNNGYRIAADLIYPATRTTTLILSGGIMWKQFIKAPFNSTKFRNDTVYTASATVRQEIYKQLSLNLQYYHTTNSSDVDLYDYNRNVYSAGLEVRF
jgi:tetratricopeptide (TPR) repeat protein